MNELIAVHQAEETKRMGRKQAKIIKKKFGKEQGLFTLFSKISL